MSWKYSLIIGGLDMSGYNMECFIADFAERTKVNFIHIDSFANTPIFSGEELDWDKEVISNNNGVFEVTQLINSFLGLIVLPNEKFKKWDEKKNENMRKIEKKIWDMLRVCSKEHRYFNSYPDNNNAKIMEFINHLRNAVSHSGKLGLHFYPIVEGGDNKITHVIFYDSDYYIKKRYKNESEAREFCLKLTVKETAMMAMYIASLYNVVEKTYGKDQDYNTIIGKLEDLLISGKTSCTGTIAEQVENIQY